MTLVACRGEFANKSPPFFAGMRAVDVRPCQIELAAIAKVFRQAPQNLLERLALDPRLKSPVTRLIRRISPRQVSPRSTRSKDPQHAIDDCARFFPRFGHPLGGPFNSSAGKQLSIASHC
jgi:hypothetical protein